MSTDLSHSSEEFLADAVSRGFFPSRGEALEAAVELLRQRQCVIEKLAEGRRQLDSGDYVEFDEEGLKQFFGQLLDKAAQRNGVDI